MATIREALLIAADYLDSGETDAAATVLGRIIDAAPDTADAHHLLGIALIRSGHPTDALAGFCQALRLNPGQVAYHVSYANALTVCGRGDAAAASYRTIITLAPASPAVLVALADGCSAADPHGAAVLLIRAVRLDPGADGTLLRAAGLINRLGDPERAAALLRERLATVPDLAAARFNLAGVLFETGRLVDAQAEYRRFVALVPGDADGWYSLGAVAKDGGAFDAAIQGYRRALCLQPDYEPARLDLRLVLSQQFPAWHFTMLADQARNDAYRAAIDRAVKPGMRVLEIGTGAGLLALMAARAGAAHVYTCELSPPMAALARRVVAANGYADRITVLNKRSTELRIGVDLPEPADVLISEILDGGLLGEGAASSIAKATAALVKPGAIVLPRGATVIAMPIACPALRLTHPVRTIDGFDLSLLEEYRNPSYRVLPLCDVPHQPLGLATAVSWIDLAKPPEPGPIVTCRLPIDGRGVVQAVAFWFDLALDDAVTLSTGPESPSRHWQQAIQFLPDDLPVVPGDAVSLALHYIAGRLHFYPLSDDGPMASPAR